ncbi:MAG: FAD-dependent oxidoreductase [Anaerolineales bacterium]|jgi:isorenieratene synthase|nr:FAD-dependent oxidoreductase [Anaerolineales bacterium]
MAERVQTIIIGAGLAGLTAALHLAERGLKPLVLESAERVGGRLAGGEEISINGATFRLEHGVHGIWSPYRNFNAMLARNNLRPVLVPANDETWIYRHHGFTNLAYIGKSIRRSFIPAPFHYLNLFLNPRFLWALDIRDWLHLFHVWAGLVFALGVDPLVENQPLAGLTLGGLTRNWSPALRAMFEGLARNALSADPQEVPLSGFLAFLRFYTLLRRDAWVFSYLPEEGGASVTEPLAARIQALGGEIRLNTPVDRLRVEAQGWAVQSGGQVFAADQLILAVESKAAQSLLAPLACGLPPISDEAEAGLFFPRSTSNAVIRFWFSAKPQRGTEAGMFSGDFSGHNFFWLDQIYNRYRRWGRETGGSALEIHIYGPPAVLAQPDALLLAQILQEVNSVWPELRGARLGQHLQRNDETHTLPAVGPAERHLGTLTPWPGLFCAGDWVRHPSPSFFLERAVVTGIAAANEVLKRDAKPEWALVAGLPAEPLAAGIEKLMRRGRQRIKKKRK